MRGIENFPNIIPPDADYPQGDIKDNPGNGTGTPVNRFTNADIHQFFVRLCVLTGVVPNGNADNVSNGYQTVEALGKYIKALTKDDTIQVFIDGGGANITTGVKGWCVVSKNCKIKSVTLLTEVATGNIVIDIWKDSYANYPPTNGDSITAAAPPTITGAYKSKDITLTDWVVDLVKGDILYFNVDSVLNKTQCEIILEVENA